MNYETGQVKKPATGLPTKAYIDKRDKIMVDETSPASELAAPDSRSIT